MDRQIVYAGQVLPETTLLQGSKDTMIALGKLAAGVLGTETLINGFAVTPTAPASLQLNVAAGEIYSLQNIDDTAFSSLAADLSHQIVKQGLLLDPTVLTLTAPATSGYSVDYLIQVGYRDVDDDATLLPYYNSANPSQPYSGLGNNGQSQNTVRRGQAVVSAKAGVAASTGTQQTPAPDNGCVGAYVVTVDAGQTQVVAGGIAAYPSAPWLGGMLSRSGGNMKGAINEALGAAVASSAMPDIWSAGGNVLHIAGTTTITGFAAAPQAGARRRLVFDAALTLTNSSTLILPDGANISVLAGDSCEVLAETTTTFRVVQYTTKSSERGAIKGFHALSASETLPTYYLDYHIQITGSMPSGQTVTLPDLAGIAIGKGYWIRNNSSNSVTIATTNSQRILVGTTGVGSFVLYQCEWVFVFAQMTGSQWDVIGNAVAMAPYVLGAYGSPVNVTSNRAVGTTYYNTSPVPRKVSIQISDTNYFSAALIVDSTHVASATYTEGSFNGTRTLTYTVRPGGSYSLTASGTYLIEIWTEE